MKIAVLGYGTIGSGVVEVLETNKESITKRAGEEISVKLLNPNAISVTASISACIKYPFISSS